MKVLLVNGSGHTNGTTMRALTEMIGVFEEEGVETEVIQVGSQPISDCIACGACNAAGKCAIDDGVNEFMEKARNADGFVFATPVYYAHPSGRIFDFLDRAFFSNGKGGAPDAFRLKPGAAVAVARRGGTTAALDALNKYFGISEMPIVGSTYWNNLHGLTAQDADHDEEGLQTMRNLARNMTWMMRCFAEGRKNGIPCPEAECAAKTNFVRR